MFKSQSRRVGHTCRANESIFSRRMRMESLESRCMLTLLFDFNPVGNLATMLSGSQGVPAQQLGSQVLQGFNDAAAVWQSAFDDDVTVRLEIDFDSLAPGILGGTLPQTGLHSYSSVRSSLLGDVSSDDDSLSSSSLQASSDVDLLLNRTLNNPNGTGSAVPYLDNDGDANNTQINLTRANAKALGLVSAHSTALDAFIVFSDLFSWDFDSSNGIGSSAFDFVAVAAHEIGHALGFRSGVDVLDTNSPNGSTYFNDNAFTFVSSLDLFRFSSTSYGLGAGIIDWTADSRTKYFSLDGGSTQLATFSTGVVHGDGQQASHWKDGLSLGLMDPTLAAGIAGIVTALDVTALDVIGWDRLAPSVTQVTISGSNPLDGDYNVPTGSGEQIRTVPVGGANTISISFNKEVVLDGSELSAYGEHTSTNYNLDFVGYSNGVATWELASGVFPADQIVLTLADNIVDAFGTPLDGDWTNPYSLTDTGTSVFPSGDGYAGGDFEFFVTIMPGDVDLNNEVSGDDFTIIGSNWQIMSGMEYTDGDASGDGAVDGDDFTLLGANWQLNFEEWPTSLFLMRSEGGGNEVKDLAFAAMAAERSIFANFAESGLTSTFAKSFRRILR